MFHATARALRTAADQRLDDGAAAVAALEPVLIDDLTGSEPADVIEAPALTIVGSAIEQHELARLHMEFRWAESKLMQASERLAEAQEARRKDLVALACMRRELRGSWNAERAYIDGQLRLFRDVGPKLRAHEGELAELVDAGAHTAPLIGELASVRTERKLYDLAIVQASTQLLRIDDAESTLEFEVANEAYDREPDGRTMKELARLRSNQTRAHRAAVRARTDARDAIAAIGIDTTFGEVTAVASFLAAEYEGDARAGQRLERLRRRQAQLELRELPEPASAWKAGLRHPVSWIRARRMSSGS